METEGVNTDPGPILNLKYAPSAVGLLLDNPLEKLFPLLGEMDCSYVQHTQSRRKGKGRQQKKTMWYMRFSVLFGWLCSPSITAKGFIVRPAQVCWGRNAFKTTFIAWNFGRTLQTFCLIFPLRSSIVGYLPMHRNLPLILLKLTNMYLSSAVQSLIKYRTPLYKLNNRCR